MRKLIVKIVLYLAQLHVILLAEISWLSKETKTKSERNKLRVIAQLVGA